MQAMDCVHLCMQRFALGLLDSLSSMSQVESQGEGEKHEIEAILQCVKEDGVYTFAVKWFGYPEKARDTVSFQYWEPYVRTHAATT